ncbi:BrnT family toxin [Paradevosia shaoguanensis]|uniref:BrnT family toxin n=1 Tax=Paradevosia shaoguanensis TaxID=1335043 RepID=UPI003C77ED4C
MRFEWDEDKNESNWRRHHVKFETAAHALFDPFAIDELDRDIASESRWRMIDLLFIVYAIEENHDQIETIRIISARYASRSERRRYETAEDRALRT